MPDISLIIPAYNEEIYLSACLQSIYSQQTSAIYEVIVVDNNSSDHTVAIASQFNAKILHEKKLGPASSRNTGAKAAQAPLLYFLDADCRIPAGGIDRIVQAFRQNNNITVVSGPYIYDQDGIVPLFATKYMHYFTWYHWIIKILFDISQFPGGNVAVKADAYWGVGGYNEAIHDQEIVLPDDLDLAIRLHKAGLSAMSFSRAHAVFSSFRRVKKSPLRHTFVRFIASIRMLQEYKSQN